MTKQDKKILLKKIISAFESEYPNAKCSLTSETPFQLLVATRLSAQCTDARVNLITPSLFKAFPTPKDFAEAEIYKVEELIKSCGLYHTKAKDLINLGKTLCEKHNGNIPSTLEELIQLPGVGRKTANLIMGDVYKKPAVVADTHFIRLSNRMGFVKSKDPIKVEACMKELLPPEKSSDYCHRTVLHGRAVCTARNPKCESCIIKDICAKNI